MKVLVVSDLHLEHGQPFIPPKEGFDVAIIAGDIDVPAAKAVQWAQRPSTFPSAKAVVYVVGNHESYGQVLNKTLGDMKSRAAGSRVHALDCSEVIVEGVRFLGATLWTDFACRIDTCEGLRSDADRAMDAARHALADFRAIRTLVHDPHMSRGRGVPPGAWYARNLTPEDTVALHISHRDWIAAKLNEPFDGPTVVVSHHAPHRRSLAPRYAADWVSGAFVSELPREFFEVPVLWAHGHTHSSFDYLVGGCRVVCNPRGYAFSNGRYENADFEPGFIVEIKWP